MKLLITTVAGVALVALAGCNRAAPANNVTANIADNAVVEAPTANDSSAKPAADANSAAPADEAAPAGGDKPAGGTATETSSDDQPAEATDQGDK